MYLPCSCTLSAESWQFIFWIKWASAQTLRKHFRSSCILFEQIPSSLPAVQRKWCPRLCYRWAEMTLYLWRSALDDVLATMRDLWESIGRWRGAEAGRRVYAGYRAATCLLFPLDHQTYIAPSSGPLKTSSRIWQNPSSHMSSVIVIRILSSF